MRRRPSPELVLAVLRDCASVQAKRDKWFFRKHPKLALRKHLKIKRRHFAVNP